MCVNYHLRVILHRLRCTWHSLVFVNEVAHLIVGGVPKVCHMGWCRKHFDTIHCYWSISGIISHQSPLPPYMVGNLVHSFLGRFNVCLGALLVRILAIIFMGGGGPITSPHSQGR